MKPKLLLSHKNPLAFLFLQFKYMLLSRSYFNYSCWMKHQEKWLHDLLYIYMHVSKYCSDSHCSDIREINSLFCSSEVIVPQTHTLSYEYKMLSLVWFVVLIVLLIVFSFTDVSMTLLYDVILAKFGRSTFR